MKCRKDERININFYDIFGYPLLLGSTTVPKQKPAFYFSKNLLKPLNGHDWDAVIAGLR